MKIILFAALFLSACASRPMFHRGENGYAVSETPIKGVLLINLGLPPDTKDEYRLDYLARAAGEECAARKFRYFDFALSRRGDGRAFCYEKEEMPEIGVKLDMAAAYGKKPELRVADTQMGKQVPLKPWDIIRKVSGHPVRDVAELKESILLASRLGNKVVSVSVERSEIPLVLPCEIYSGGDQLSTPETLDALRVKIPGAL
ncbi:MAG: hypothetical protein ACXVB9_09745 [Bdellovibrionota bacterium]